MSTARCGDACDRADAVRPSAWGYTSFSLHPRIRGGEKAAPEQLRLAPRYAGYSTGADLARQVRREIVSVPSKKLRVTFFCVSGFRREISEVEREIDANARGAQFPDEIEDDTATLAGRADAAGNDGVLAIPRATAGAEIVVPHARPALARVDDPPITRVDGDVADRLPRVGEHDQVARPQMREVERHTAAGRRLGARGARQSHAVSLEDVLHEPGAVESRARGFAAPRVLHAEVLLGGRENRRGAAARGGIGDAGLDDTAGILGATGDGEGNDDDRGARCIEVRQHGCYSCVDWCYEPMVRTTPVA